MRMHMQFYESEAYYWLAVKRMAELLAADRSGGRAPAWPPRPRPTARTCSRRSTARSRSRRWCRCGTAPTARSSPSPPTSAGFAAGAWGWRRCQGHVGAIYWDTVQSADPLISPSRPALARRTAASRGTWTCWRTGCCWRTPRSTQRTAGYDAEKHWFSHASWQYQCGLERHANIHLAADDAPNFLRSMLNQYAVDIMPGEYTFREHTTGGPPDKIYEESCFLERFRQMLVMEDGGNLWLARATPRAWLAQGKHMQCPIALSHFGLVSYRIESNAAHGTIRATVELPSRLSSLPGQPGQPGQPGADVLLRLRHPTAARLQSVEVNGKPWNKFDAPREVIRLVGLTGRVEVIARYRSP